MTIRLNTYQPSAQHGNADGLSRLPIQEEPHAQDQESPSETVCAVEEEQLQSLPIGVTDIKTAIAKDPVLSQVYNFTVRGWPKIARSVNKKVKAFFCKRFQLSTCKGCLLWSLRVIVPHHSVKSPSYSFYMKVIQASLT